VFIVMPGTLESWVHFGMCLPFFRERTLQLQKYTALWHPNANPGQVIVSQARIYSLPKPPAPTTKIAKVSVSQNFPSQAVLLKKIHKFQTVV
jgi:hypothetical protein